MENTASNAWNVFHYWYLVPGISEDGTIDEKVLSDWVESSRKQCLEMGKIKGCDIQIGFILARAPSDPDGNWPHIAVRNIIEKLKNKTIEDHIVNGLYNDRGVTSRGMNDGGNLERDLSKRYFDMSKAMGTKWLRTASVLSSMSKSYEYDAKRWDVDSNLNELRF